MTVDERTVAWYRCYLFGRFVLGVSHEVDNYMSVILGFAELLKMYPREEEKVVSSVEKIIRSADALSEMFKTFAFHAKTEPDDVTVFSMSELIDSLFSFAGYDLKRGGVELEKKLQGDDFSLKGDRRTVSLILLSLMLNAAESMREGGGLLTVEVARKGEGGIVKIVDRGEGIPSHLQEKVFEPFFTTREEPFRLGLGLSVSRFLLEKMGGKLKLVSREDEGTTVEAFFPFSS
ncbi:MAG: sensor histidine kinase [Deltaproteobacteria bacterium]|nr:MAG: sensor histidine kinase [Deltaproteobacteria bacterium]